VNDWKEAKERMSDESINPWCGRKRPWTSEHWNRRRLPIIFQLCLL